MKTTKPINLKYEDREWVYLMLREGMRARKLHRTLAPIAEINPTFLPDYSHAVLAMLGFQNPAHDLHKLYNEMLDRYAIMWP